METLDGAGVDGADIKVAVRAEGEFIRGCDRLGEDVEECAGLPVEAEDVEEQWWSVLLRRT